jgi:uncharacterized protein
MDAVRSITPALARRIAVTRQRLAGPCLPSNSDGIMKVMRDLGWIQIDPMTTVTRSHLLVLWSRLGQYDPAHLSKLLWEERRLFEDWAHGASIVLMEDYPIFSSLKRTFATGQSSWAKRVHAWLKKNQRLRRRILIEIRRNGPLPTRHFEDESAREWHSTGWTAGRNVDQMLYILWAQGKIMVAGRTNGQKLWDLTERCLPKWAPRERLSDRELTSRAVQRSLHALGVARASHIKQHFIRGSYPKLAEVLAELEADGRITRVNIQEDGKAWPDPWYIYTDDLPLLDRLEEWKPRTTLLSPFDNLVSDRQRTEQLFGFKFRVEIYVPKHKRQHGYYVMPILHGDRLIGRIDPVMDRTRQRLTINAVYAEPYAPTTTETARQIAQAINELGSFLGAREIVYGRRVPAGWRSVLAV